MKNKVSILSFEMLFSMGIIICLILPSAIMAKPHQQFKVMMGNSGIIINEKNINLLQTEDRQNAIKKLKEIESRLQKQPTVNQ